MHRLGFCFLLPGFHNSLSLSPSLLCSCLLLKLKHSITFFHSLLQLQLSFLCVLFSKIPSSQDPVYFSHAPPPPLPHICVSAYFFSKKVLDQHLFFLLSEGNSWVNHGRVRWDIFCTLGWHFFVVVASLPCFHSLWVVVFSTTNPLH
jgi:hypothetical protein